MGDGVAVGPDRCLFGRKCVFVINIIFLMSFHIKCRFLEVSVPYKFMDVVTVFMQES